MRAENVFTAVKFAGILYVVSIIAMMVFLIWSVLQISHYIQDECHGSVSYCVGKTFKESKQEFNAGQRGD
jgi:hypothetical protein